jgi:MFS family permease
MAQGRALPLAVVSAGQGLWVLDLSLVTVALPSIQAALAHSATVQWVPVVFAVAFGGALPAAGRAADLYSRRTLFVVGSSLFGVASLLAGLAPSLGVILAARFAAGVAAALLVPSGLAAIAALYPDQTQRAWALGICGAVLSAAFVFGAAAGGWLTAVLGWRTAVLSMAPVAFLTALLARRCVPVESRSHLRGNLHALRALLLTAGVATLLLCVNEAAAHGWLRWASAIGALVAAFCLYCLLRSGAHSLLISRALLSSRKILAPNLAGFLLVAAGDAVLFLLTLHLQRQLGYTSTQAGLCFALFGAASVLGGLIAGTLIPRVGAHRALMHGLAIQAAAVLALEPFPNTAAFLLAMFALFGAANMAALVCISALTLSAAPGHERGAASGLLQTSQQFGAALGVTLVGVLTTGGAARLRLGLLVAVLLTVVGIAVYGVMAALRPARRDSELNTLRCSERERANDEQRTANGRRRLGLEHDGIGRTV